MNKSRTTTIGTEYEKARYAAASRHQGLTLSANDLFKSSMDGLTPWDETLTAAQAALNYMKENKGMHPNRLHHLEYWRGMVKTAEAMIKVGRA